MKTAIIYRSHHGTTEKVASMLREAIGKEDTSIFNLKTAGKIDLGSYDKVIIGGSIHAGNVQKSVKVFCNSNMETLLAKPLGLFLSCMEEEKAQEQFDNAFPELLRSHARSCKLTGGEFNFDRMNFLERAIIKKISGIKESVSKIDETRIREMVLEMSDA